MRKSPDKTSTGTRKLISYLFAGLVAFVQAGDINTKSGSDDVIECESCKKTRERMIEKFRQIKESAPKKTKSDKPKENSEPSPQFNLSDCDPCKFA